MAPCSAKPQWLSAGEVALDGGERWMDGLDSGFEWCGLVVGARLIYGEFQGLLVVVRSGLCGA